MEQNGHAVLTGAELMARARKEIDLPGGGKILVGRLPTGELAQILGAIPDVSALASLTEGSAESAVKRPESKAVLSMMEGVIRSGVIAPRLVHEPQEGPTVRDFTLEEQVLLFQAILSLSGYTKAAGAEVLPL